ncbi:helix-turn-helix transcriptional regulator [Aerococcaceae bacterium DSM 111022]|nr:helix-turn-helix transcriptional regulator [Aerococcaceae bacterium DSM 111022]
MKDAEFKAEFYKESFKLDIAKAVRELREEQNLSRQNFADKVGISKSKITCIENAQTEPKLETLYDIAEMTGKRLTISYR